MRRLLLSVFVLLFAAATVADASAQNRSSSVVERIFSSVVGDEDGRKPTVIMGDEERGAERGRGRTTQRDRGDEDVREGRGRGGGRGTVDGRRGRSGDVERGDGERGRTQRGLPPVDSRRGDDGDDDRDDRDDDDRDDRDDDRDDDEWDDDYEDDDYDGRRGEQGKRGKGPKFCRTGEGHPVFGRDWCREKGFGLGDGGYDNRSEDGRYEEDDDILGRRQNDRYDNEGGWLGNILGRLNN